MPRTRASTDSDHVINSAPTARAAQLAAVAGEHHICLAASAEWAAGAGPSR